MGCSYDPVPYTYTPSPEEIWRKENHFKKASNSNPRLESCEDCGQVFNGKTHLHPLRCPVNPREVVPMRDPKELNDAKFQETRYR